LKETHKMPQLLRRGRKGLLALLSVAVLAGCASGTRAPAPIEDRSAIGRGGAQVSTPASVATTDAAKLPSGIENAGKPGYYTVRPGDTLIRIALDTANNWRDVARWNNIDNPNMIEVGQVLRIVTPVATVAAPGSAPGTAAVPASGAAAPAASTNADGVVTRPVAPASSVIASPVPPAGGASARPGAGPATAATTPGAVVPGAPGSVSPPAAATAPAPAAVTAVPSTPVPTGDEDIAWAWPAPGNTSVLAGFDEARNKGLDISGKAGDPVQAAADGRVVYAGAGLRGYGNLIILKHNNTFLTAYAHNQTLLVKEDQVVRKGQKIAEMGQSDADRVKLHFEIRRQGKPVDPSRYLANR
jgi:lipoprotein NlpD